MDPWDFQEEKLPMKQYFAEANLVETNRGKRIIEYDTLRDRDDLDKTQRVAADVIQYIKQGYLNVGVTEKHRNEKYIAPGHIFSKRMYVREKPTQQAAKETMLDHLKDLLMISALETKRKPQAEPRTLGRPQIEDGRTSILHHSGGDSDDWFESERNWINSDR
ncbi:hypothetical protein ABOM_010252 [Aspergillus bombycis]|uniref:Uncharacterized protein n=1 Tax=Aspergillus bombycis TaxID=109264 RepID=A0A1F7ZPP6_9EURO|nr:hypothetical protein ABOM_010252 [Aspergillus bombycis]OGM41411.1 hypothetical protein ABOM_010252 [Aspergillus bombycis]